MVQDFATLLTSRMNVDSIDSAYFRIQSSFGHLGIIPEGRVKGSRGEKRALILKPSADMRCCTSYPSTESY